MFYCLNVLMLRLLAMGLLLDGLFVLMIWFYFALLVCFSWLVLFSLFVLIWVFIGLLSGRALLLFVLVSCLLVLWVVLF